MIGGIPTSSQTHISNGSETMWSGTASSFDSITLTQFGDLVSYTTQGIALFSLFMDYSERDLLKRYLGVLLMLRLPVNIQCSLKSLTFELLFSSKQGHECLVEFVGAIMQKQLEKDAVLDPIVDVISQRCPMFLTPVDVLFFQVF